MVLDTGVSCLTLGYFQTPKTRKEVERPDLLTQGKFSLGNKPKEEKRGNITKFVPCYKFSGGRLEQNCA